MTNIVHMPNQTPSLKIKVLLETRPDGGLRAWSEDVPGFVLSHPNSEAVVADIPLALSTILAARLNTPVDIDLLVEARSYLAGTIEDDDVAVREQEYVAHCA